MSDVVHIWINKNNQITRLGFQCLIPVEDFGGVHIVTGLILSQPLVLRLILECDNYILDDPSY